MSRKIIWKGSALLAPVPPVMVSCGTMEKPNIITVGWTGIVSTHPPKTYISVRPERFSYPLIRDFGVFTVNLTSAALVKAADFCGVRSGNKVDKFSATGLTAVPGPETGCPVIEESPLSFECRVTDRIPMGSHEMFLADIVSVLVDSDLLDDDQRLRLDRCGLAAYAHGSYYELGRRIGTFGFSVRKKPRKRPGKGPKAQRER